MNLRLPLAAALTLALAACNTSDAKTKVQPAAARATAPAEIGKAAPAFAAADIAGAQRTLAEHAGKVVVLEWNNPECPFVKKHYSGGSMQALQKELTAKGVVWVTINSGAAGKQGALDGAGAKAMLAEKGASPSVYLIDGNGKIGKAYGAKTTPHMFVIDAKGTLVYAGAIDDKATSNADDVKGATNWVRQAVEETLAGKPVTMASTQPYGCSVKY